MHTRFPGCDGAILHQKIIAAYAMHGGAPQKLRYYSSDGRILLSRHPLNKRKHDVVMKQYMAGIVKHGILPGVRGTAIAIPKHTSSAGDEGTAQQYFLLGHATLAKALYAAHAEQPTNEQVMQSIAHGLPGALVLTPKTPRDVLLWLKEKHNEFHQGAGMSVTELFEKAEAASQAWSQHCQEHKLSVRGCPPTGPTSYARLYDSFVMQNYPSFQNAFMYSNTSAFVKALR